MLPGCADDWITYYVFSYFLSIWRKIRSQLEEFSMVWWNFCIVFFQIVVIQFCPKSCNSIGVLSLFSEKSCKSAKQDIKWRIEDMKIEVQSFLEDNTKWRKFISSHKTLQDKKNTGKRVENCIILIWGVASCAPAHQTMRLAHGHSQEVLFSCFPNCFFLLWKSPTFTLLAPK